MTWSDWTDLDSPSVSASDTPWGDNRDTFAIGANYAAQRAAGNGSGGENPSQLNDDPIYGDKRVNSLVGTPAQDIIFAKQRADTIAGGKSADILHGEAGADVLRGNAGTDKLYGNAGVDILRGNAGKDKIYGILDNDVIFGGRSNDVILGGRDDDWISGGRGDDTIRGGKGADTLIGRRGTDVFAIAAGTGGKKISESDLIVDFKVGKDLIRLVKGLALKDLDITTDTGNVVIQDKTTDEFLAVLQGVKLKNLSILDILDPNIIKKAPIQAIDPPMPPPNMGTGIILPVSEDPGNTLEEALDIASSSDTLTYQEQVSAEDIDDFYAFSVGASSTLTVTLTGLDRNVELFLMDCECNVIQSSVGTEVGDEFIAQPLEAGTYFIQVKACNPEVTDYNLNVTVRSNLPGITNEYSDVLVEPTTFESSRLIRLEPTIDDNGQFIQGFRNDPRFVGIDGTGFSTVILDTGIDLDHPFFGPDADGNGVADRIVYSYDFADGDADASDRDNHGSNVSSIVASQDEFEKGMAPGANIIHLKVFPDIPHSDPKINALIINSAIQNALNWAGENAEEYNIASVNLSLGNQLNYQESIPHYYAADELQKLKDKNVIVVAAAGNEYYKFNTPGVADFAADPNVLGVGATWDENVGQVTFGDGGTDYSTGAYRITNFSQRHPDLVDIFAPGGFITGANYDGGTVDQAGTSQAAPHIAGIAVLAQQLAVQELGRRLTFEEFRDAMIISAVPINDGDDEDDNVTNTGLNYEQVSVQGLGEYILYMASIENPPPPPPPPIPKTQYNFVYLYDGAAGTSNESYSGYTYAAPGSLTVGTLYDPFSGFNERGTNGAYFIISEQEAPSDALLGQTFVQQYNGAAVVRPNAKSVAVPYYYSVGSPSGFNGLGSEIDFAQTYDAAGQEILELFGGDYWAAEVASIATDIGP